MPFRADVFRFVYWLCRDRALAEDVVQETLLRAWRSLDSLGDDQAARPWLLTIARRELARVFERKRAAHRGSSMSPTKPSPSHWPSTISMKSRRCDARF